VSRGELDGRASMIGSERVYGDGRVLRIRARGSAGVATEQRITFPCACMRTVVGRCKSVFGG
jgi:hypothetical protein